MIQLKQYPTAQVESQSALAGFMDRSYHMAVRYCKAHGITTATGGVMDKPTKTWEEWQEEQKLEIARSKPACKKRSDRSHPSLARHDPVLIRKLLIDAVKGLENRTIVKQIVLVADSMAYNKSDIPRRPGITQLLVRYRTYDNSIRQCVISCHMPIEKVVEIIDSAMEEVKELGYEPTKEVRDRKAKQEPAAE